MSNQTPEETAVQTPRGVFDELREQAEKEQMVNADRAIAEALLNAALRDKETPIEENRDGSFSVKSGPQNGSGNASEDPGPTDRDAVGEEPVNEIEDEPWPRMPEEAYHGPLGDLVRLIEPHSESDPVALLIQGLVMFGNVVGRNRYFIADGSQHYVNLFAVLVGKTSRGRKGTSWGRCVNLFSAIDKPWSQDHTPGGLGSGEGLIWAVRDPIYKTEAVREGKEIIGYQEVQVDSGITDKRLLLFESEFASVLKVMGRDGSTLSATIRQAFDTGNLRIINKNSPAKATGAHISIVGHITKVDLLRYLDSTEACNGFANRFLWPLVKRSKLLPEGGNLLDEDFGPVLRSLKRAFDHSIVTGEMKRDGKAREIWHTVYETLTKDQLGLFGSITARAEAHVMRLACVYALLDVCDEIKPDHLRASLALWTYCEESVRLIFGAATGDTVADRIIEALRMTPRGMSRNDIREMFQRHVKSERIDRALILLVKAGKAYFRKEESNGGRPIERWFAGTGTAP
jgi:hypothetical protein